MPVNFLGEILPFCIASLDAAYEEPFTSLLDFVDEMVRLVQPLHPPFPRL